MSNDLDSGKGNEFESLKYVLMEFVPIEELMNHLALINPQLKDYYQNNLVQATNLFSKYSDGIVIGGLIAIKYQNGINLIIEGFDKRYTNFNSNYLLKWELIKKFNQEEYGYFNLNGIVGEFKEANKYSGLNEMKLGYNATAIEYIGEFDLIINKPIYNIYTKRLKKNK